MKVLVLGCNGMAGHVVAQFLIEKGHSVYGLARKISPVVNKKNMFQMDVTDFKSLERIIKKNKFDYIVNCIGILNKQTEIDKVLSISVNSLLPHYLVKMTNDLETRIIHISTDCVFSGKEGFYSEKSEVNSTTFYGRTKSIGEIIDKKNLTIRTSIVGPDINEKGIGLFNWFMKQHGKINGYTNAFWSGLTTIELANIINLCIENKCTGLVNMVNNDNITKYDLLKLFKKYFHKNDLTILKYDEFKENKTLVRTNFELDYLVPSYDDMVKKMKLWVEKHKSLYDY